MSLLYIDPVVGEGDDHFVDASARPRGDRIKAYGGAYEEYSLVYNGYS